MAGFRKTKTPGVFIRHRGGKKPCPAAEDAKARCRCEPSYAGKRRNPATGKPEWSPATKNRAEVLTWLGAAQKGKAAIRERQEAGLLLGELGDRWLEGVKAGAIGKRRGKKGSTYSDTTIDGYERSWNNTLKDEHGGLPADELDDYYWQTWVDGLARQGLSRSRVANHVAVLSAIYGWASRPTRRLARRNPMRAVELPPNDEVPRLRVASRSEAAALLDRLEPEDQVPYACAFYGGFRRSENHRLEWPDVIVLGRIGKSIQVGRAKSAAGTGRRPPIANELRVILQRAWERQGKPETGRVLEVSVMSGKLAERAHKAWGWIRDEDGEWVPDETADQPLEPITLHNCRHTYATWLMAAGYTLKDIQEFLGHSSIAATERYVKRLPQPDKDAARKLDAYLRRERRRGNDQ